MCVCLSVVIHFCNHIYRSMARLNTRSGTARLRQAHVVVGRPLNEGEFADFSIFLRTLDCTYPPTVTYCHKRPTKLFPVRHNAPVKLISFILIIKLSPLMKIYYFPLLGGCQDY